MADGGLDRRTRRRDSAGRHGGGGRVGALEATAASLGLSDIFVGVIVLALVGTASDLVAAAWFARRGKFRQPACLTPPRRHCARPRE
ncbi:MAG: sodium/calcium exchanger protein [Immundisolibacter sp.]|uniref:sodium/calcium exchanger protein n=1 Tax=Immundisolibacter sp. TaxID=1934948 RepID=UPI003EE32D77